ncbi:hypothetical protein KAK07_02655 [Ideonella sp. 4Y16]|uniref:hypothetical protein n=1 Tax=Ideonella alba TaxID=2824118 RepID=UPI001B36EF3A|nr:hypothetical protein [Ideonella alba]MBQ0942230.1 hypothetical protein [Ideonella alba]
MDASGGRGLLPARWPARAELPCARVGYAGGLSAQALPSQWSLLQAAAGGLPDWIDAETTLRDEADHFSLARCHAWLATAARLAGAAGLP